MMPIIGVLFPQPALIPLIGAVLAEKVFSQIIVYSGYNIEFVRKKFYRFAADKAG